MHRLALRKKYQQGDIILAAAAFKAHASLSELRQGSAGALNRLEAVILSIMILRQILVSLRPLPQTDLLVVTARRTLMERWSDIVGWCTLLASHITPTLLVSDAQYVILLVGKLSFRAVQFEESLLLCHDTADLAIRLWITKDRAGNGVYLERRGACPILDLISLCLASSECREAFEERSRERNLTHVVVKRLLERVSQLSLLPSSQIRPTIANKIASRYVEIVMQLLIDRTTEKAICKSQLFLDLIKFIRGINFDALYLFQTSLRSSNDFAGVPPHAFMLARTIVYSIMQTGGRYRLRILQQVVEAGVFDIFFAAFLPYYPDSDQEEDIRGSAISIATLIFVHSPYRSLGLRVSDDIRKRLFGDLCNAVESHSPEGKGLIEAFGELQYRDIVSHEVLSKPRSMCACISVCP